MRLLGLRCWSPRQDSVETRYRSKKISTPRHVDNLQSKSESRLFARVFVNASCATTAHVGTKKILHSKNDHITNDNKGQRNDGAPKMWKKNLNSLEFST